MRISSQVTAIRVKRNTLSNFQKVAIQEINFLVQIYPRKQHFDWQDQNAIEGAYKLPALNHWFKPFLGV